MSEPPVKITVTIPPEELRQFESLLKDMRTMTGKSAPSLVNQAARFYLQSARAATKISATKRPIEANPNRTGRGKTAKGAAYRFRVYSQTKPPSWIYTNDRMDQRRKIRRRGLARMVWSYMISKTPQSGSAGAISDANRSVVRRAGFVDARHDAESAEIVLTNKLGYVLTIHPNIQTEALSKARNRLETKLLKDLAKKQEATWRT